MAPPSGPAAAALHVEVVYSPRAGEVDVVALRLPAASTLLDAVHASGLVAKHGLDASALRLGIWSKAKDPLTPLRERDRVEIYRALRVDPKEARRQRYKRHLESVAARAGGAGARRRAAGQEAGRPGGEEDGNDAGVDDLPRPSDD